MKQFWLTVAMAGIGLALNAQTNSPKPTIESDSVRFDLKTHTAVYRGQVRVNDPRMKMTCELLTATMPETGERIDHIVGEQNVVIDAVNNKGQPVHATGDKVIYTYKVTGSVTNENVELTGNPRLETQKFTLTGDPIDWDRATDSVTAEHEKMTWWPEPEGNPNLPPAAATKPEPQPGP